MAALFRNSKVVLLTDQCVVSGTTFTTGIILARILGPAQFGIFAFAWLVLMIILSFQFSFFIQPMQILLPRMEGAREKHYRNAVFYLLIPWALLAGISGACIVYFSGVSGHDLQFSLEVLPLFGVVCFQDFMRRSFIIRDRIRLALISDGIYSTAQLLLMTGLCFYSKDLHVALIALGLSYIPPVIFGLWHYLPRSFSFRLIRYAAVQNWLKGKWLLATSALQAFTGNYFLLIAPSYLGVAALGAIRLAQNLMGILNVLLQAFDNYVPASAARLFVLGNDAYRRYLGKISMQAGIAFAVLLGGVFLFSDSVFSLAGGSQYEGYGYILKGFCIIYIIMYSGYPLRTLLRLHEKTHHIFIGYVIACIFSISTAGYFVGHFGVNGVLTGLIIVQAIMVLYMSLATITKKITYAHHTLHTREG